jgi:microcompartment protein CcmK/EutM
MDVCWVVGQAVSTVKLVLVARGSAARETARTRDTPTDAAIVGILDSLTIDGETTYRKS